MAHLSVSVEPPSPNVPKPGRRTCSGGPRDATPGAGLLQGPPPPPQGSVVKNGSRGTACAHGGTGASVVDAARRPPRGRQSPPGRSRRAGGGQGSGWCLIWSRPLHPPPRPFSLPSLPRSPLLRPARPLGTGRRAASGATPATAACPGAGMDPRRAPWAKASPFSWPLPPSAAAAVAAPVLGLAPPPRRTPALQPHLRHAQR